MPDFRLGKAASLLGMSVDTLRRWADSGRIPTTRTESGHRLVAGADVARLATELAADGVEGTGHQSARNRFSGIVTKVTKDKVMAQVELQCGPNRVVSLVSREAVDELGLEPGVLAVAVVKATNVVLELPPGA